MFVSISRDNSLTTSPGPVGRSGDSPIQGLWRSSAKLPVWWCDHEKMSTTFDFLLPRINTWTFIRDLEMLCLYLDTIIIGQKCCSVNKYTECINIANGIVKFYYKYCLEQISENTTTTKQKKSCCVGNRPRDLWQFSLMRYL